VENENIIKSIDRTSPLHGHAHPGDRIVSINGNRIKDVLDYKYYAYDEHLEVLLRSPDGQEKTVRIRKREGGDLGVDFEEYLMDKPRSCANNCIFCFIDQLPKGMRKTMYFKDDDARLSFLMGNYITLTNISPREVQRIIDLHISPINVSVHTTNPELRCKMLRNPNAGRSIDSMRRFAENGIVMNCQIVCCPDINDGAELDRTMRDLADMYPGVHSVSVVPLGVTKFREGLYPLTPFTKERAEAVLDQVTSFGDECKSRLGTRIFFCGDELYIKAQREIPEDEFYEEYTQLENGVGMFRLMETEFSSALKLSDEPDGVPFSIATGVSAAPFFDRLLKMAKEKYPALNGRVYAIENDFFGHSINVTGLVTGGDLINQLKDKELGQRLFISQNMLRRQEMDFLDDVTLVQASNELGIAIYPIEQDGFALWDAMSGLLPEVKLPEHDEDNAEYYKYNGSR
jgi:putative radical SAM enzyme (TIGR03279 family)